MKLVRIIALVLALLTVMSFAVACNNEDPKETTTTTTTKKTTTLPPAPDHDPDLPPDPDPETPITGEEFDAWHNSFDTPIMLNKSTDITPFNENEGLDFLFDGMDGYFGDASSATKLAGSCSGGVATITVEFAKAEKIVAYSIITGGDAATYGRTPEEWYIYGSQTGEDDSWTELDYVYDGSTENADATPYGYTIDADKQGEYKFYKYECVCLVDGGSVGQFQLNEMYFYITKATVEDTTTPEA